jgi:uncharacterized protein
MNDDVLRATVEKYLALRFRENIFIWQGGEPLLAGRPFFNRVIECQKQYGHQQVVGNVLQTNGVLVNPKWVEFFARYKFFIGLSIDGPIEIHDTARGEGSHAKAMRAARLLARVQVPFNVLAVISHENAQDIVKSYEFLRTLPTSYLQFIPALDNDPQTGDPAPHSLSVEEYGSALCAIFDQWASRDAGRISIRDFDAILSAYQGHPVGFCTLDPACARYLVIENEGDVYPCDFFVRPEHRLGNILEDSFEDLLARRHDAFEALKPSVGPECDTCEWQWLCHGGCPKDRVFSGNATPNRTFFCEAYKQFFAHAASWFESHATA